MFALVTFDTELLFQGKTLDIIFRFPKNITTEEAAGKYLKQNVELLEKYFGENISDEEKHLISNIKNCRQDLILKLLDKTWKNVQGFAIIDSSSKLFKILNCCTGGECINEDDIIVLTDDEASDDENVERYNNDDDDDEIVFTF